MHDNKMKIRIQIHQPRSDEASDAEAGKVFFSNIDEHNVAEMPPFDWYKIALALFLLAVIIGGIGYLIVNWRDDVRDVDGDKTYSETEALTDLTARFNYFDETDPVVSAPESQTDFVASDNKKRETVQSGISNTFDKLDNQLNSQLDNRSVILPGQKPGIESKSILPVPDLKPEHSFSANQSATLQNDSATMTSVAIAPNAIDHPKVVRAQLSHAVRQREPIDNIDHVRLDEDSSKSIYFFAELLDFSHQQVTVKWYFKDRLIAQTKHNIGGEKWRTYANKLLYKQYIGSWRAVLEDQAGNQLAERHFVVSGPTWRN